MDIKTVCAGLLTFGEASGYEIKKLFEDGTFSGVYDASFGSIYPALTRLAEEGHVLCRAEEQQGRPDKKVYSLTPKGRAHFIAELSRGIQPDKVRSEFAIATIFAHLLPRAVIAAYIDQQIEEHRAALARLDLAECDPSSAMTNLRFAIGFGRVQLNAAIDYLESHRGMLEASAVPPDDEAVAVSGVKHA
ncbi:PadR family transcriptional regulator [Zavarzinia compransoris]|uniref:helix-turn-helix transcriptional regulator n=1 Tax=Zavarzinia marina TaxID=2911065 RepID=UPI001F176939|nr:helix-turn-helix transcriptional regulator [Zavarzinia marina]MCF4164189.1 PadR family transcriptional regulator [Zavarzinia marina]